MNDNKHMKSAHQWNPPPIPPEKETAFIQPQNVVSATECTGLVRQPIQNVFEAGAFSDMLAIHQMKPQGNIGKGNPNNAPSEIAFHRGLNDPTTHESLPTEKA